MHLMLVIHTINPEKKIVRFLRHIKITNNSINCYNKKYDIRFQVQFTVRSAYH